MLATVPRFRLTGLVLHRIYRADRSTAWWFASAPADVAEGGRFDLAQPRGTCYFGTSAAAALLEALQDFGAGLLPESELRARRRAEVVVPDGGPDAAHLTSRLARGRGVTQALWADDDRARTQRWATALDRAGWRALRCGVQHDPSGRLRVVALFDEAGAHRPYEDPGWTFSEHALAGDPSVPSALAAYGITVTADPQLPVVSLQDFLRQ